MSILNEFRQELKHKGSSSNVEHVIKGLAAKRADGGDDNGHYVVLAGKEIINELAAGLDKMEKQFDLEKARWKKYEVMMRWYFCSASLLLNRGVCIQP